MWTESWREIVIHQPWILKDEYDNNKVLLLLLHIMDEACTHLVNFMD